METELDPEITAIQDDFAKRYRLTRRWIIVDGLDGFEVHDHTIDGVAPPTIYVTRELAAARLLQLLGLQLPVTPQSWPEPVEIGHIDVEVEPE